VRAYRGRGEWGARKQVTANRYERDPRARQQFRKHHGFRCAACAIDLESVYGRVGRGFTDVHHRVPLAKIGEEYKVDPIQDLIPVCPNCHAMLHRPIEGPELSVEELQALWRRTAPERSLSPKT